MKQRLQKIISGYGLASRRRAEELIIEGHVSVNGEISMLGDSADPETDEIIVSGSRLRTRPEKIYIMLNKPRGYVTTLSDERGRKNVSELVAECGKRVFPVGRLDLNSEGLLILTNDGELANKIMHPRNGIPKEYMVWARGDVVKAVPMLKSPMELDGRRIDRASVAALKYDNTGGSFKMTIYEGRNRQIRRMCETAGLYVTRLKRISEGGLMLGGLGVGQWRYLTDSEISALNDHLP